MDLVLIVLVAVAAFAAGWFARGRAAGAKPAAPDLAVAAEPPVVGPARPAPVEPLFTAEPRGAVSAPDPAAATRRLLDRAVVAYEAAVERWLDEGEAITPAGRAALGELDRAIKRADVAASRIEEGTEARFSALDALDALREAARALQPYREGRALDSATSRELDRLEDEIRRACEGLGP